MSIALYRKYRPQTFAELAGQNHIKTTLENEITSGRVVHAFLFSGPRGLGKTSTARLLAKAVNCLNRKENESEPCNQCDSCRELNEGKSLDIIEIDAASHTGVENVRENIIGNSRFTPTSRKFKVFIIDEVHMLSVPAFNALLKTLEEPPAHAMFILATTELHKVPETIISRCQHFEFRKVNNDEILKRLKFIVKKESKVVDDSVLNDIVYYSQGCIRDSESLLGQILSLGDKEITAEQAELVLPRSRFDLLIEFVDFLIRQDSAQAIDLINKLMQNGVELEKFAGDLIEFLRKLMLVKVSRDLSAYSGIFNRELDEKINSFAESVSLDYLVKMTEVFLARKQELKYSDIIQLPLELAVIEITGNGESEKIPEEKDQGGRPAEKIESNPPEAENKKKINKTELSLSNISEKWDSVLLCLKKYNHSLASTLKICQVGSFGKNGELEICSKHKFHQQRLNEMKNKQILEKVFQEVFGVTLVVRTSVVDEFADNGSQDATLNAEEAGNAHEIADSFGGQIVE